MNKQTSPTFASLVQEFFTDHMVQQRALSPCTEASYRDTFVLLLRFAETQLGKAPSSMKMTDMNAKFLANFLDHLEGDRHNSARSRNIRKRPVPTTLAPNSALLYQAGAASPVAQAAFHRVGSNSSIRLLGCVGSRLSTSVR